MFSFDQIIQREGESALAASARRAKAAVLAKPKPSVRAAAVAAPVPAKATIPTEGQAKPWGEVFSELGIEVKSQPRGSTSQGDRPEPWDKILSALGIKRDGGAQ
jgi:hypothetical protein